MVKGFKNLHCIYVNKNSLHIAFLKITKFIIKLVNKTTFKEKLRPSQSQLLCSCKITLPFDNVKKLSQSLWATSG